MASELHPSSGMESKNQNDILADPRIASLYDTSNILNEDHRFWWQATAVSLSQLLEQCHYREQDRISFLQWYATYIVPALGPRPKFGKTPLFQPCPVFDGSAVEHNLNWKESSQRQLVRFTIEATGYEAGTSADLFNQNQARNLLQKLKESGEMPGLDLDQFKVWVKEFFFSPETAQALLPKVPVGTPLSQVWIAFDLIPGSAPMVKVYFMPFLKWIHTGISSSDLIFQAARNSCRKYGTYDDSIAVINSYLQQFSKEAVIMGAIDCIDSPSSRVKIYVQTRANTLAGAKQVFTLGGRLSGDSINKGLEALTEFWSIIFRLSGSDINDAIVFPEGTYCGLAVEMKPNQAVPDTKLHLPVRRTGRTDGDLCELLSTWFQKRGHSEFGKTYKEDLATAFPDHEIESTGGTHTFVPFAFGEETGIYMTMYYSTKIFGVHVAHEKEDMWVGYDNLWQQGLSKPHEA